MMEPASSSDEEEDRETLIHQNDEAKALNHHQHHHRPHRAAFEIGELKSRIGRGLGLGTSKKCLLAICLPLLLVLLFFSLDLGRLFRGVSIVLPADSPTDGMREAELRALYLLRNQQSSLLALWNRTLAASGHARSDGPLSPSPSPPPVNSGSGSNSSVVVSLEDLRSALLKQMKLNRQIQKTLLSTHRAGNTTSEAFDDNAGPELPGFGVDACRKVNLPAQRRTIEWKPKKDRFLFAICASGQMSNHLICLEKHMFFAALLDRVLILPSPKVDYQYDRVLDIKHINDCFGRTVVMPFEEFTEMKKNKVHINRLTCYMAVPPCFIDEDHIKKLKNAGVSLGKIEAAWPEDAKSKEQKKRAVEDIMHKFSTDDEVLAIGDVFYANVEAEWVMQPGGPLAHKCKTLIQPSRFIILTAQRFMQTFLGGHYIALHFRRYGFLKFCNVKKESCFFPIPQAAECILRVVERANAPVIYLSTDAAESETNLLQSLVVLNDKAVPMIRRPEHNSAEKWDALLQRNHIGGDKQVEAMLDKTICAMSSVFIGSSGSTFTDDIFRLRRGWGSASKCDENLCQGELPNYIAELE